MQINSLTYNVFIDGKQWPDEPSGIQRILLFNRMFYMVGACDIILDDPVGFLGNQFSKDDGVKIRIETGNGLTVESWNYRLVKSQKVGGKAYRLLGIEDQVKLIQNASTGCYDSTSSSAISTIAGECGMTVEADTTADKMVWMGFGRRIFEFARQIALRGYAGSTSLMWLCSYKGKLLYKDLNAIDMTKVKGHFSLDGSTTNGVKGYVIHRVEALSHAGVHNSMGGYGSVAIDQSVVNDSDKTHKDISVRNRADQPALNQEIKAQVTTPPTHTTLLRSDNTHDNYNQAMYQNIRGMGQLSETIVLTTSAQTTLGLLDVVEVSQGGNNASAKDPTTNQDTTLDGKYLVDSRNIHTEGQLYWEIFLLRREGTKKSQ